MPVFLSFLPGLTFSSLFPAAASAAQLQFLYDDPTRALPASFLNPNTFPCPVGMQPAHPLEQVNTAPGIWQAMGKERASRAGGSAVSTQSMHIAGCAIVSSTPGGIYDTMNSGHAKDGGEALSSTVDAMAKGAAQYYVNFEEETRLRMREREEKIAAKGSISSPQRFEELNGAELAGLETLLGL